MELGRTAPIGQEFELVVLNDLEFQLTLSLKLDEPRPQVTEAPTTAAPSSPKKQSTFSRVFGSPKKRKDSEAKQIEAQRAKSPTRPQQPSLYDMVQGLVARDGSFARAYVTLSEHEKKAFGRPYVVDITCFNEWAMEQATSGSARMSKGLQRRPPYKIGKLELQMLYVPKPKGAKDEDMPKSMNACIRELREAENCAMTQWEGHLSQQGGDCPVCLLTSIVFSPIANVSLVLETSLLQIERNEVNSIPRSYSSASREYQSFESCKSY